jgi:2-hydroxy-3-oxopropionate reductase
VRSSIEENQTVSNIGFVGLGIMGGPMCRNLLKAGHKLVVYDVVPALVERVVGYGATAGDSARAVAEKSEIVITMLPDGPQVDQAVLGPAGVLEGARPGSTIVDMSSISPLVAQKVGAACAAKGVRFLDAPVSGGEPKAVDGTLAIMVGGDEAVFDEIVPVLQVMGPALRSPGRSVPAMSLSWPTRLWWPATSRPWERPLCWLLGPDSI